MASTVGSLYYKVMLDASGWARGASKIKAEQKALIRASQKMMQMMDPKERLNLELEQEKRTIREAVKARKMGFEEAKALYRGITAFHKQEMDKIVAAEKAAQVKMKKGFAKFADDNIQSFKRMTNGMTAVLDKFSAFAARIMISVYALRRLGSFMWGFIEAASEKKKQLITLTTLMGGNQKAADELRTSLVSYAKQTAFSVKQTMELAAQMSALGIAAEDIAPKMRMFGTLAMGDPAKFKLIAKAYTDVKSLGRLMGREVIQFANQGVPLLSELALQFKVTTAELMKMIEAGAVSFDQVDKALKSIKDRFGDIDKAALQTAAGQLDALKEGWEEFKATMFSKEEGFFKNWLQNWNSALDEATLKAQAAKKKLKPSEDQTFGKLTMFSDFFGGYSPIVNPFKILTEGQDRKWWERIMAQGGDISNSIFGTNYTGMADLDRQFEMEQRVQAANDEAARKNAEKIRKEKELIEKIDNMKKQMHKEEMHRLMNAKMAGDEKEIALIEGEKRIKEAYQEALAAGMNVNEARSYAAQAGEAYKNEQRQDFKKKEQREKELASLPSVMFRQNSVEEFRFMAQMRESARREARADARAAANNDNREQENRELMDHLDKGLKVEIVDDTAASRVEAGTGSVN